MNCYRVYIVCEGITEEHRDDKRIPDAFTPQRVFINETDACIRCEAQAIWSFGDDRVCESPWLYYDKNNPRHKVFIKEYNAM